MPPPVENRRYQFANFEADPVKGELLRYGMRVKLQEQPFRLLTFLLARPGETVSRDDLRKQLWPEDTFVEFDNSLNVAVGKLRDALRDDADVPRFVETVPRYGYRFIAPVSVAVVPESTVTAVTDSGAHSAPSPQPSTIFADKSPPRRFLRFGVASLVLVAGLGFVGNGLYRHYRNPLLTQKDTILLADFTNTTGEPVFDDALKQGLEVGLEQSPFLNLVPDRKAGVILKQMGRSEEERVAGRAALEVCQRANARVMVQGLVSSLGTTYLIGLAAIRCDTGDPIVHEEEQARRKEEVVDALGRTTARLRARLGESLPSIQKFNAPLEQATTSSLEALKAYSVGVSYWDREGDRAAAPYFKRAVELDPNFAMAYGALASIHQNLEETELARESATKAYELRERASGIEKILIESWYHMYVTGDLEKAAHLYEIELQDYPGNYRALNDLGTIEASLGRTREAVDIFRKIVRMDPLGATTYGNLAMSLMALGRVDEAAVVLAEASQHNLQSDYLLQVNYWRAFLSGHRAGMEQVLLQSHSVPGAEAALLATEANTEAYAGHFQKAHQISKAATEIMTRDGDKESAAGCWAEAALREAEAGVDSLARESASHALLLSQGADVQTMTAMVNARMGNEKRALTITQKLEAEHPANTILQGYWLPTIRGEIDLQRGEWAKAVGHLTPTANFELAIPFALSTTSLYPAYVRGQAYLADNDGKSAAAEFQKLIDRPGLTLNSSLGPLARLGRARAFTRAGDTAKAKLAYQEFLQLWQTADPNIPVVRQARSEFAKLQ